MSGAVVYFRRKVVRTYLAMGIAGLAAVGMFTPFALATEGVTSQLVAQWPRELHKRNAIDIPAGIAASNQQTLSPEPLLPEPLEESQLDSLQHEEVHLPHSMATAGSLATADGSAVPDAIAPCLENGNPTLSGEAEAILLDEPATPYSSGQWLFDGGWYFQEDIVVLLKTKLNDQPLAVDSSQRLANPAPVLTTMTDSPTCEPGVRIALGKILCRDAWNRDHMLEFRFFGMFDWPSGATAVRSFATNPNLGIDTLLGPNSGDVTSLFGNTSQRYIEHSQLDSYELNFRLRTRSSRDRMVLQHDGHWIRHQTNSRIWSCYAGLANMSIDEEFDLLGRGPGTDRGHYTVLTSNDMYGIQFGGEYSEQAAFWNWGVRGRLGGFANLTERRSRLRSTISNATTVRTGQANKDNMVFLLETGLFASLQIHPNATLRAGYDFMYLTGIAQATGNLGLPAGTFGPLKVSDDALYHGGSVGFTMVW